jgi:hypothetical protein
VKILEPIRMHVFTSQSTGVLLSESDREPASGCEAGEGWPRSAGSGIRALNVSRSKWKIYLDYIKLCRVATARLVGSEA